MNHRITSILLSTPLLVILAVTLLADEQPEGPCETCQEGFRSTTDVHGAMECAHGPEYDPDCVALINLWKQQHPNATDGEFFAYLKVICWESNGNNQVSLNGQMVTCKCMTCFASPNCEGYQLVWSADCGFNAGTPTSQCVTHSGTANNEVIRIAWKQQTSTGANCGWQNESGSKKYCGKNVEAVSACTHPLPSYCVIDEDSRTEFLGRRKYCGPGEG